jgi:hypothetical protein
MMSRRLGLSPDLRLGGGASAPAPVPVMEVRNAGDTVTIAHNDATPDLADGTQFVTKNAADNSDRTFLIKNTGDADLTGVNVLVPSGYTLVTPPDATIAALGSDTFVVRCNSATPGSAAGNITIESTELADHVFAVACTVRTYLEKLQTLNWNQLLALSETSGTNADDSSSNNLDGTYDGVSLNTGAVFTDGTPAPLLDGVNDFVVGGSAGLISAFSLSAATIAAWVKMDAAKWEDANFYVIVDAILNSGHRFTLAKNGAKRLQATLGSAAGGTVLYTIPSATPTDYVHVALSYASNTLTLYYQGAAVGTPAAGLTNPTGTLTTYSIGRYSGSAFYWPGNLKYIGYKNTAMIAGDIALQAVVH